jgi:hypothetical protein
MQRDAFEITLRILARNFVSNGLPVSAAIEASEGRTSTHPANYHGN